MNEQQQSEYERLLGSLKETIKQNGGDKNLIAYQFGALFPRAGLYPREVVAQALEKRDIKGAAQLCRSVDGLKALTEAVRAKSATLCSQVARGIEPPATDVEVFLHVKQLQEDQADSHTRSWGVYVEHRKSGERASDWIMGARMFVSPAGMFAASPVDVAQIDECRDVADGIVAFAHQILNFLDNALASRVLSRAYSECGCFVHICEGLKMGLPSKRVDQLVRACLEIRALTGISVSVEPKFRGGLAETYVSESIVRDLQSQVDDLVETMRGDTGRDLTNPRTVTSFRKRRQAVQDKIDTLNKWRDLLHGWDSDIEGKLLACRDAYAGALNGTTLELPHWADEPVGEDDGTPDWAKEQKPVKAKKKAPKPSPVEEAEVAASNADAADDEASMGATGTEDPFAL